jgi:hypothetical protein
MMDIQKIFNLSYYEQKNKIIFNKRNRRIGYVDIIAPKGLFSPSFWSSKTVEFQIKSFGDFWVTIQPYVTIFDKPTLVKIYFYGNYDFLWWYKLDSIIINPTIKININNFFDQVYVIGKNINANLNIKYKLIDTDDSINYSYFHLQILQDAKRNNYKKIFIFDNNDIIFDPNFELLFSNHVQTLPSDWNLLYLGCVQLLTSRPKYVTTGCYQAKKNYGSYSYGIKSQLYDFLIELIASKITNIEGGLLKLNNNKSYIFYPNLVHKLIKK